MSDFDIDIDFEDAATVRRLVALKQERQGSRLESQPAHDKPAPASARHGMRRWQLGSLLVKR